MRRLIIGSFVLAIGCSDDGVPAGGSESTAAGTGSATASQTDGAPTSTATTGVPTTGTSEEPTSDTSGEPPGSTSSDTQGSTSGVETLGSTSSESGTGSGSSSGDSSSSTSGGPGGQCLTDDDCVLVDDCCTCAAASIDDAPVCDIEECDQTTCSAQNVPGIGVQCRFGSCEFEPIGCNLVFGCDDPPPDCGDGLLPSVVDDCWGPCVPSEACDYVPSCEDCPDDEICVVTGTQVGLWYSCEPQDPSCGALVDCDCMVGVCQDPFECAEDGVKADLSCVCPVCG